MRTNGSRECGATIVATVLSLMASLAPADAIEIRDPEGFPRYSAELTRAYAPCLSPNDTTVDGDPACSPAVTSACTFDRGRVDLIGRAVTTLRVDVFDIGGPGTCTTGTYTVELALRITADEAGCGPTGQCTYVDQPLSFTLLHDPPNDLELAVQSLETILPGALDTPSLNVQGVRIIAPDGLPMAAAGIGSNSANTFLTTLGTGYRACAPPTTTGALGPACDATWPSACDHEGGNLRWRGGGVKGNIFTLEMEDITGAPPTCANGTHTAISLLRITTTCSGASPCTAVDFPAIFPAVAKNGDITIPRTTLASTGHFATPPTSLEILGAAVIDPDGNELADPAFAGIIRLSKTKATLAKRDLALPDDDLVRLEGRFPVLDIDPNASPGATFTVADREGVIYQVSIPEGLWQLSTPVGTRWEFQDPSGGINGVRKISIKQFKEAGEPAGYKIKLVAEDVDVSAADLLGVTVSIAMPPIGGFSTTTGRRNRTCKSNGRTFVCK